VSFALLVDEIVFARERWDAFLAGFLMGAAVLEGFKVVAELLVADEPLAVFAFLVVRVLAWTFIERDVLFFA
jgi:hypothetical protein